MSTIQRETFRRILALVVVSKFPDGVYGRTRFQKTVYQAIKNAKLRPFAYDYYEHGQYSQDLVDTWEQLLSMGYLTATPLKSAQGNEGNRLSLNPALDRSQVLGILEKALGAELVKSVDAAVKNVGFQKEELLLKRMYEELTERGIQKYDNIFYDNLPESVEVHGLDDEECENLDIALNPEFYSAMSRVVDICSKSDFDRSKVKKVFSIG